MPRLPSFLARRTRKRDPAPPTRIRSALFVDFDNVFHGLHSRRPEVADALARSFCEWLSGLTRHKLPPGAEEREIILWRAYVNPKGGVKDDSNDGEWLSLSRFRQPLLLSGFEVVDCPALTSGMKNAADIRMVVDVLASVYADPSQERYDEFIIASDDADFTPLLQHLRALDRRTMIISAGSASRAYTNLASSSFDFLDYLLQPADEAGPAAAAEDDRPSDAAQVVQAAEHLVARSRIAIPLTVLEAELKAVRGAAESWFGYDSLLDFLQKTPTSSQLRIGGGYVWDPERHPQPKPIVASAARAPMSMMQLLRDTVLPKIDARQYWGVFAKAASYVGRESEYVEDRCVSWCRDSLAREGVHVAEQDVRRILARSHVHAMARSVPPPTPQDICNSLLSHTTRTIDGRPLRPSETRNLQEWLEQGRAGARVPARPASPPAPIAPPANPIRAVRPENASEKVVVKGTIREITRRTSTYKAFKVTNGSDFGRALGKAMLGPLGHGGWGRITVHQPSGGQFLSYTFWIESDMLDGDGVATGAKVHAELEALDLAGLGAGMEWVCKQCDVGGDAG